MAVRRLHPAARLKPTPKLCLRVMSLRAPHLQAVASYQRARAEDEIVIVFIHTSPRKNTSQFTSSYSTFFFFCCLHCIQAGSLWAKFRPPAHCHTTAVTVNKEYGKSKHSSSELHCSCYVTGRTLVFPR